MPIKDRTRRRLVRLGTIRLGIQVPNANNKGTHPVQTDYFVLKDAPELVEVYGEKPRELDVLLPFPDIDRNFVAFYQVWAGGVLVCQGDGEYVQYATPHRVEVKKNRKGVERTHVYNAKGDTLVSNGVAASAFDWNGTHYDAGDHVPCPGAAQDLYPHCRACKLGCLLKVMMADPALFRMGYYQISTGSARNHDTILGMLEAFPADRVNSVPFKLRLVQEQITYNENGERKKTNKWFLQLEPDPTITRKLYSRMASRLLDEAPKAAALPSPGPDWDSLSVDVPEPPPFVVEGKDASSDEYYADDLEGNGFLDGELEAHRWSAEEAKTLCNWWRNELCITNERALGFLGVSKISEFAGDFDAAQATINAQMALEVNAPEEA